MENNDLYTIDEKGNIIIDGSNPERAKVITQFLKDKIVGESGIYNADENHNITDLAYIPEEPIQINRFGKMTEIKVSVSSIADTQNTLLHHINKKVI